MDLKAIKIFDFFIWFVSLEKKKIKKSRQISRELKNDQKPN